MKISLPNSIFRHLGLFLLVIMLLFVSLLSGCSSGSPSAHSVQYKMAPMADMSAEIQQSTSSVSDSYRFAVANPDALKNVPCYCGCVAVGHTSNYSCYVKEIKPSGEIVFDQHALNCGICVDITLDVMKMTGEGKIPKDIRAAIDQRYAQFGPSNMPPVQYGQ